MDRRFRTAAALSFLLVAFFAPGCAATGRADDNTWTAEHVALLRNVDAAAISPSGRLVAYVLRVPRVPGVDDDGPPWTQLHVVDLEGNSRPFVAGKVNVGRVAWKPDGSAISFTAKLGDDKAEALYAIPVDGGEARPLITEETGVGAYAWSPDGLRVCYTSKDSESEKRKELKKKGFDVEVYEEDLRSNRAYVAEIADPKATRKRIEAVGSVTSVRWSPDGSKIGLKLSRTPEVDLVMMFSLVHVYDAATLAKIGEPHTVGKLAEFAFSRDGRHLALIGAEDIHDPREGRLYVCDAAGGPVKDVYASDAGHVVAFDWQNDKLMYIAHERTEARFAKVDADGANARTIFAAGGPIFTEVSLAADGMSGVMIAETPDHPAEVYYAKHGDAKPRRLTHSNPKLDGLRLAKQEVITHKARDGLDLDGILIHPLDEEPGKRYPLILHVHGGPEAHNSNGWYTTYSRLGQVFAAKGYAVFYPNYRGSTGRGVAFSKLGQRDYGGKEFDDLIDAVDHLIATGLVDPAKVGVTGGSYGGFATAWLSTKYSSRIAAGVMAVGISDHIGAFGTTEIPQEFNLVHARCWPWEDWEFYLKRSPIYYAEQGRTPLLILVGKEDTRVDPSQSRSMYRFLKVLGQTPVRLVEYPGEGHGNSRAASRYDYSLRLLQWMDHYLHAADVELPEGPEYRLERLKELARDGHE
ncbi:MAG: hypothetical protein AMXMBFR47_03380 [Planctomycetota bacterium]